MKSRVKIIKEVPKNIIHKDWKELEWFSNKGYIVAYSDNHAEVPQEVISVYKQVNTPELQEKCRKLSNSHSCFVF